MATKIERIDREIAKTREKIAEYQEKLKTLEAQKTEAENLEIVQMVLALRMTPEQLSAMLSGGTLPGMAAHDEQELSLIHISSRRSSEKSPIWINPKSRNRKRLSVPDMTWTSSLPTLPLMVLSLIHIFKNRPEMIPKPYKRLGV